MDAKVEDPVEEKAMQEEMKIEKALERLSAVKIPSYGIIEKLYKIIKNYYQTIEKSETIDKKLSTNETNTIPSYDVNSNIENHLHYDNSKWEDIDNDSDSDNAMDSVSLTRYKRKILCERIGEKFRIKLVDEIDILSFSDESGYY